MDREEAERFLRDLSGLPWTRREPVGLGFEARGAGPEVSAGALFLGGALVHLSAAGARRAAAARRRRSRRVLDAGAGSWEDPGRP